MLFNTENGFIDGRGKTFLDRIIQDYLPYIKLRNGECNHLKRYDQYPIMNFYFEKSDLSTEEEKALKSYLARTAYYFQTPCKELLYENGIIQALQLEDTKPLDEILTKEVIEKNQAVNG